MSLSDYVLIHEAAALLGVVPNTLRNWERRGKLVAIRHPVNGYRLYRRADLEQLLLPPQNLSVPTNNCPTFSTDNQPA